MTKANLACIFLLFSLYIFYYNHLLQTQTILLLSATEVDNS